LSNQKEERSILRGRTLKVYQYIVRSKDPARVREIQRHLEFSSPSLVVYHLEKLKEKGLIREEAMGYVPDKVILNNLIRLRNSLIPRFFFYSLFFTLGLVVELTILLPNIFTKEYFVAVIFTLLAAIGFGIETYLQWRRI
jgi:DNA-binding transcriptional ArsR family regulator